MSKNRIATLKRLLFFWATSFIIATTGYYMLWLIMPQHYVFGTWYKMFLYHSQYPMQYVAIPCFVYGLMATFYSDKFYRQSACRQIVTSLIILISTILISLPIGGMLWNFHDMQSGYFPTKWVNKMLSNGISMGLSIGWLIIALSIPYNILGAVIAFFLTKKGAGLFRSQ